ncbi:hypothetical protein TA3x_005311 [Tundrisphaera sp. TA3]|uniref:hypothetical protein n=1 Tax=Tundrisphaera sp. TA3 TaxID=3435775 RepID=UPI003EBEB4D8
MRAPRITVRRLMVLVAIVAGLIGGWMEAMRLTQCSRKFRLSARVHLSEEGLAIQARDRAASQLKRAISGRSFHDLGDFQIVTGASDDALAAMHELVELFSRRAEYHRSQRERYEHAARYPWLSIGPDQPYPQ